MEAIRNKRWILPAFGLFAALATNTLANADVLPENGIGAVLLLPVLVICWCLARFSRTEMGFVVGRAGYYGLALLHPVLVLSLMALVAWAAGAVNVENPDWSKIALDFTIVALPTMLMTLVSEDGFFRGWLWASLKRVGLNEQRVVLVTGIAFGIWHLPFGILGAGYDRFSAELPLYIINASLIGVAWGLLRLISGSLVVVAVTHAIWNAAAYVFFNNGSEIGVLGIQNTSIFGPEAGVLGLSLTLLYALGLWLWYRRAVSIRVVSQAGRARLEPGVSV
jgi:membrane protease YdiL (CAAX protease family)